MYEIDLDKFKDAPPCRGHYQIGNSYCALGKLIASCGLEVPVSHGDGLHTSCSETRTFIDGITNKTGNRDWMVEVSSVNDAPGDLKNNHEKAFRMAVNTAISSGLVKIKNSVKEHALS